MILLCLLLVVQVLALPMTEVPQESGIKINFKKTYRSSNKRDISASISKHRLDYVALDLQFGTQEQLLEVILDTGSCDLWVIGAGATCGYRDQCLLYPNYNPAKSAASKDLDLPFKIVYWDDLGLVSGGFYQDDIVISGVTVQSSTFAVANYSAYYGTNSGILGIGFIKGEENGYGYTNFPAQLVKQGLISSNYYSLYLDAGASTGSILFGGIDSSKYEGSLTTIPFVSDELFIVNLTSVSGPGLDHITNGLVGVDSGAEYSILPNETVLEIANLYLNPVYNSTSLFYDIDCNAPPGNLILHFGDASIEVPLSYLILEQGPTCQLFILTDTTGFGLIGDNILSWAYLVYDLDKVELLIAKAKF